MNPWRALRGLPLPLYVLAAANLINRAGSMVLVLLTLYLTRSAGFGIAFAGMVVSVYGATKLFVSPLAGRLCDRVGARAVAITSLALSGSVLLVYPLVQSRSGIVAVTIALSATTEAFRPAQLTLVGELSPPGMRKTAFSLQRLAANLGMSVGPALGGLLATMWFPAIFIVDGVTSALAAIVLLLALDRHRKTAAAGNEPERGNPPPPAADRRAHTDRRFLYFLIAHLGTVLVFFQFLGPLPLFMVEHLGLSERTFGLVFTVNTVLIILFEVPLNAATERWPARRVLALGALLVAVGFGAAGWATGFWTMMATVVVWTVGEMILFPAGAAYVASIAPTARTGEYMGLFDMLFGLGFAVAPWAGVTLLGRYGGQTLWSVALGCGLVSALLLAFVGEAPRAAHGRAEESSRDEPPPSSRPAGL